MAGGVFHGQRWLISSVPPHLVARWHQRRAQAVLHLDPPTLHGGSPARQRLPLQQRNFLSRLARSEVVPPISGDVQDEDASLDVAGSFLPYPCSGCSSSSSGHLQESMR
ncbi:hypothetical protein Tsubulata_036181 [Turnera subulata]|uniref:Uncharacterized protein n=1 Tax=Turnera subulata TaxID=218843 RepID=A0A9Q0G397_9ROSI|nr:hypothetical protein Tsubulata_036181 [Turnera subulata]